MGTGINRYPNRATLLPWCPYILLYYNTYLSGSILWIPLPVHPLPGSLPCIPWSINPYIQRYIPWIILPGCQCRVDRSGCIHGADGYGIHGLYTSLGTDESLRSNSHHQPTGRYTLTGTMDTRWLSYSQFHSYIQIPYNTYYSTCICIWLSGIPCIISPQDQYQQCMWVW